MKILILSDSHGRNELVREAIGRELPFDLLIHAGDTESDLEKVLGEGRDYDLKVVAGNMDRSTGTNASLSFALPGGHHVFLSHGHHYGVSFSHSELRNMAQKCHADIAIYGHTHIPYVEEEDGILVLNPGSIAKPRQQGYKKTYAVMHIDEDTGSIDVQFKSLPSRGWL